MKGVVSTSLLQNPVRNVNINKNINMSLNLQSGFETSSRALGQNFKSLDSISV